MPNSNNTRRAVPRCPDGKTYSSGCRCDFCKKTVNTRYQQYLHQRGQREKGIVFDNDLIDATPTRKLLLKALEMGLTDRDVEVMTKVSIDTFARIRRGTGKKVYRYTANAITDGLVDLDIPLRHPMTLVDSSWARQMTLSLAAQGYTFQHQRDILQNNLGKSGGFIASLNKSKTMYYQNVELMRWLVRAVGDSTGPSVAHAKRMQSRGIFPTKHYNVNGELIRTTLTKEQKALIESV